MMEKITRLLMHVRIFAGAMLVYAPMVTTVVGLFIDWVLPGFLLGLGLGTSLAASILLLWRIDRGGMEKQGFRW